MMQIVIYLSEMSEVEISMDSGASNKENLNDNNSNDDDKGNNNNSSMLDTR